MATRWSSGLSIAAAACLLAVAACATPTSMGPGVLRGWGYSQHVLPLTMDLDDVTAVVVHHCDQTWQAKEPYSGLGFYARGGENGLGHIARKYGVREIYYADVETFSVFGFWEETIVHLYGR